MGCRPISPHLTKSINFCVCYSSSLFSFPFFYQQFKEATVLHHLDGKGTYGRKRQRSVQILVAFSNGNKKGDEYREVQTDVQQLPLLWDGRDRVVQKVQTPISC